MSRPVVTVEQRRGRLARRHLLAGGPPAGDDPATPDAPPAEGRGPASVADALVVLHATDPATFHLSVSARLPGSTVADVQQALFDDRTLFRTLAMRRTLFVVSPEVAPAVERSSCPRVAANERKRLVKFMTESGLDDPERRLARIFDAVLEVLDGPAAVEEGRSARRLAEEVPELATRITLGLGTRQETEAALTSRVLGLMAVEGLLIRGRSGGGWTNRLYAWHRRDRWWPAGAGPRSDREPVPEDEAAAELVARYLRAFGPATETDVVWWTGWTKTATRAALAAVGAVEVDLVGEGLDGTVGLLAPDDPALAAEDRTTDDRPSDDRTGPWASLLPALDATPMGWKERDWFLGPHRDELFDRNGNIGPTVWVDGRIVGGWAQRPDGEVVVELLADVGADHLDLIEAERERVAAFVGDTVVKPSFPTPLQKRLAAG